VTTPPAPAAPAASPTYDGLLVAQVQRNMRYPPAAQRTNIQGRPIVRFTLARNGSLLSVELTKSCGHSMLDDAAVATVKRAAPFPPFPPELTQAENTWNIPVNFELLRR
jgi:protein TonB